MAVVAHRVSTRFPFVLAANRDEHFARPTAKAAWWSFAGVDILGGRDLEKGGTWLGVTRAARVAVVTNVRIPPRPADEGAKELPSRGWLVRDALTSAALPPGFAYDDLPPFNLLVAERDDLFSLREDAPAEPVTPGVHGVSNHRLDTAWPKVSAVKRRMAELRLEDVGQVPFEALFAMLRDDVPAPDAELPSTGVPLEIERLLSPPFVRMPGLGYGTRSSTVVVRDAQGRVEMEERTFDPHGALVGTVRESFG